MRVHLTDQSFVDHLPGFLPGDAAAATHAALADELTWEQRSIVLFGREVPQPRLVAWAGELPYRYSGQTLPPRAFTPTVAALLARVNAHTALGFNHVLANRYRDGRDSMGNHADAEPELGEDPAVVTLSFGATRRLVVVPRGKRPAWRREFPLASGDLFLMAGACQRELRHGLPRQAGAGERISLTFRRLLRAPPAACP